MLYRVSLDDLIDFDIDMKEIEQAIEKSSVEKDEQVDWTKAWGKKYPILLKYQSEVNIPNYGMRLREMLDELKAEYGYSELDAFLVLKDILAQEWKKRKEK